MLDFPSPSPFGLRPFPPRLTHSLVAFASLISLAATPFLRAATARVEAARLVNIDFTAHLNPGFIPKLGPAAAGASPSDLWNIYSRDVDGSAAARESGVVVDLVNAGGTPTSIDLAVTNAAGFWASDDPDAMFRTYLYPGTGSLSVTLSDLPAGSYDLYGYAHGAADQQCPILLLTAGSGSPRQLQTSVGPGWNDGVFVEGDDYVVFRDVPVQTGEALQLDVLAGSGGFAVLNGLQLVRVGDAPEPQAALIVPPAFASLEDDGYSHTLARPLRLQQVYAQSFFPAAPIQITALRLRRDSTATPFEQQVAHLRLTLAATPKAPDTLSLQWAENLGSEPSLVYDAPLAFASIRSGPDGAPNLFDVEIPFMTPFFYDPAQGHLLVEFITTQGAPAAVLDGSNEFDDLASRVFALDSAAQQAVYADTGADILEIVYTLSATDCEPVPDNLVAWWPAEDTAEELVTATPATLQSGATYAPGHVGQAFDLRAPGSHVRAPDRDAFHLAAALTVEAWVHPQEHGALRDVVSKWDAIVGPDQRSFCLSLDTEGVPYFIVSATGAHSIVGMVFATNTVVPLETWTHLAATYDGVNLSVYVDGELRGRSAFNRGIHPGTGDLGIGGTVGGLPEGQAISAFSGLIDEVGLYARSLTDGEIRAICEAGTGGKCLPEAPQVFSQPQDAQIVEGGTATFTVYALGTGPLHYQWWTLQHQPVDGATESTLTLSNILAEADGAQFYVVISNSVGLTTSDPASLTVHTLPRIVTEPQPATAPAGSALTLSVVAAGTPPLSYLWFKEASPLIGAEAPMLVLNNLKASDVGRYQVRVSSPYGETYSQTVAVQVVSGRLSAALHEAGPVFTVQGEAAVTYLIEWSADLRTWHPLATLFDVPETWQIPDLTPASANAQRFYRLRRL